MEEAHAIPFTYSEEQLSSCASHLLSKSHRGINDCRDLFLQHAAHYNRAHLTDEEELFWMDPSAMAVPSRRLDAFLKSVKFVFTHNSEGRHTVTLNRFSDFTTEDLPLYKSYTARTNLLSSFEEGVKELESLRQKAFIKLDSDELIMKHAPRRFQRNTQYKHTSSSSFLRHILSKFSKQSHYMGIFDSWWWIGERHDTTASDSQRTTADMEEHTRHSSLHSHSSKQTEGTNFVVDAKNEMEGIEDGKGDRWETYLNWATEDNPDGVGIVHDAMDQGLCGSCWAISALGSMEASIVRNMAYMAYEDIYKHTPSSSYHAKSDLRDISISTAQDVELTSLKTADLSVQELVDCDTRYDQGCSGGNPLLAFYFLHRFGVTSSSGYPYTGKQDTCQYHKVDKPIATVETWGILTPDHENNMEKVLRYIGPVAVGLVGADPSFLAYKGGVFSVKGGKCELGEADHAMLIVGYGEEQNKDGTKKKYWIARNSWGTGWGENGYIRMERIGGGKGSRGVCEIARSPSVALGGMFTKNIELSVTKKDLHGSHHSGEHVDSAYSKSNTSITSEFSPTGSVIHKFRARLGMLQEGIIMSTLDGSEKESKSNEALPLSQILGFMSFLCLLVYAYRKRRRKLSRSERVQTEFGANSITTDLSVICVNSDSVDEWNRSDDNRPGEETILLSHCSNNVAYS